MFTDILCFLLGSSPASELYTPTFRNTLCLPMKMEQTECSETSAYIIQTPGKYPKENIIHSEHGESLKSRMLTDLYQISAVPVFAILKLGTRCQWVISSKPCLLYPRAMTVPTALATGWISEPVRVLSRTEKLITSDFYWAKDSDDDTAKGTALSQSVVYVYELLSPELHRNSAKILDRKWHADGGQQPTRINVSECAGLTALLQSLQTQEYFKINTNCVLLNVQLYFSLK